MIICKCTHACNIHSHTNIYTHIGKHMYKHVLYTCIDTFKQTDTQRYIYSYILCSPMCDALLVPVFVTLDDMEDLYRVTFGVPIWMTKYFWQDWCLSHFWLLNVLYCFLLGIFSSFGFFDAIYSWFSSCLLQPLLCSF